MRNDNGEIKWDVKKKETRETELAILRAKQSIGKEWEKFKKRVKKSVRMTPEVLEAMTVEFQTALHQIILKQVPSGQMDSFKTFTDTLVHEARTKIALIDKPPEEVAEEALARANTFTERHPDGSAGTMWGFEGRDALMAIPCVQNAASPDLVGFAIHGSMLVAIYEGEDKDPFKVLGLVKEPNRVGLPGLKELAKRFRRKGLKFPDVKGIPKV